ncbi:hypothetical protein OYT13_15880 [Pandoraea sp. XJJ-1]|uniref:hypothetical protein n=1 Tax=Pandoraea sp. XJJ-1 TaxID=3002643 RepID=UPI00227E8B69|nr:hypothetical protein [Pandoraea sp. XJJ-1]WAL81331.1 hypothetical protein OYT13_15880 [Pandoraea sp. XJJ-1]
MTIRHSWNKEQKEALREMWKRKASTKELTEYFGIGMNTICKRARIMNLGTRGGESQTDIIRRTLEKLKRATAKDLQRESGLTRNGVDRAIDRLLENEEAYIVGTRKVSAGRSHSSTVEAREYSLVDDGECSIQGFRGDGVPRVNRVKHRFGTAPIPPRHPLTAALFGSV